MVPGVGGPAAELLGLLSSPVAQRRDDWFSDLERRLRELEGRVNGFHFDDLDQNEQFVSATFQASLAALKTHETAKLEALRNAVLNIAVARAPSADLQAIFLNFVDSFTPVHLQMLAHIANRGGVARPAAANAINNCVVQDLNNRGLLRDGRPYAARNRDYNDLLSEGDWDVNSLGSEFLRFISAPDVGR